MAEARLLRRPAAALLRRLVRRIRSVDSAVAAASAKRLDQSTGVIPGWLDIRDVTVMAPYQDGSGRGCADPPSRHHHRRRLRRTRHGDTTTTARMPDLRCWNGPPRWAARGETTAIQAAPGSSRRLVGAVSRSRSNSIRLTSRPLRPTRTGGHDHLRRRFPVIDMPMATWIRGHHGRALAGRGPVGRRRTGPPVVGFPNLFIWSAPTPGSAIRR